MTHDPRINPTDLAADAPRHWYWGDCNGWLQWHWTYTHVDPRTLPNFAGDGGETYVITDAPHDDPALDAVPFPATGNLAYALAPIIGGALAWVLVGASALLAVL